MTGGPSAVRRRLRSAEARILIALIAVEVVAVALLAAGTWLPVAALTIPLVVGANLLSPRRLPWLLVVTGGLLGGLLIWLVAQGGPTRGQLLGAAVVVAVGVIVGLESSRRSRLGVAGVRGESMLVDLRDRLGRQAHIPPLPEGWYAEGALRSAGGGAFAGDFFVAAATEGGSRLNIAVVDVSGKGEQAGTRSLLLSGAFSGLLRALPPGRFLCAANEYLLAQDWAEGFATAAHLSVDLVSGKFEMRTAGHPPAVQLHAGSGRWVVHETEGPVLGLLANAEFGVVRGSLEVGDALLLYTDGVVENVSRDISSGIDRLAGQGERLFRKGFEHGAQRLLDRIGNGRDDRAVLLVHRC